MVGTYRRHVGLCLVYMSLLLQLLVATYAQRQDSPTQSYIVYMGSRSSTGRASLSHVDRLTTLVGSPTSASDSLVYSYQNFDAFAARLTPEQASILAAQEDVVSIFPNRVSKPHTTHSWSFLGLEDNAGNVTPESLWRKSNYGEDVIIGVLDTGVWPESNSFNDDGLGPIPAKWKGECEVGPDFGPSYCNNKLIGGRTFVNGYEAEFGPLNTTLNYRSARDAEGHGTHTSSTAGGSFARNASFLGLAPGTAKGGAPLARVAVYKVCWRGPDSCTDADILAAYDQGVSDGVEVFSVSIGPKLDGESPPPNLFEDGSAIGSFHANQRNISVVLSAGNDGPTPRTVSNVAPWVTTVAASTIDRDFISIANLGNGISISGASFGRQSLTDNFPLVSAANVYSREFNSSFSQYCVAGSLDPSQVSGTIVVCLEFGAYTSDQVVKDAGGVGMIVVSDVLSAKELNYYYFDLPATTVTYNDGLRIFSYISSTQSPVATISATRTTLSIKPAPTLADFSSRGPNFLIPNLLKPDITGPGFNILAAWTEAVYVTGLPNDNRIVPYYIDTGTSMACPHVSGTIASLKAYHPTWSPAALHSAIVTTATLSDNRGGNILDATLNATNPFGVGGGHLNPNGAAEPGLVYDNPSSAYFEFLCSLGYNESSIIAITNTRYTCPASPASVSDFNYPSITVSSLIDEALVTRTVTNVGAPNSIYRVNTSIDHQPPGIEVTISPTVLEFSALGEEKSFSVKLKKATSQGAGYVFGSFTWSDGTYTVRSPLVVGIV